MDNKGNEDKDEKPRFDIVNPSASNSLRELAVHQLGQYVDNAAIGRIVQAAQEIELSRRRILSEHTAIGSRMFQIYHAILTSVQKRFGAGERAQSEADALLYSFAAKALRISRGSAIKYLQAFHHFSDNADAITFLNLGELTILKRADITEEEIQRFIDARKADETYSRKDIIPSPMSSLPLVLRLVTHDRIPDSTCAMPRASTGLTRWNAAASSKQSACTRPASAVPAISSPIRIAIIGPRARRSGPPAGGPHGRHCRLR